MKDKLDKKALGAAGGVLSALYLATMGIAANFGLGTQMVSMLGGYFIGYSASAAGIAIGIVYGLICGFIDGYIVAWVYNRFSK